jgi:hypothetical protein
LCIVAGWLGGLVAASAETVENNGVGVYYDGALYIFDTESAALVPSYDICCHLVLNGKVYSSLPSLDGSSRAQVAPLVIEDLLWLFHTGENGNLYYKKSSNPTRGWESSWHQIPYGSTSSSYEIAPVYNPLSHRLAVYYVQHIDAVYPDQIIVWVYSDDYGATWSLPQVVSSVALVSGAPSAAYCPQGSSDTLLAIRTQTSTNGANSVVVYNVSNGTALPGCTTWSGVITSGRPFVMNLSGTTSYAVMWKSASNGHVWMSRTTSLGWQAALDQGQSTTWAPTGIVDYRCSAGRWYGDFYIIWGGKTGLVKQGWTLTSNEYWTVPGP